MRCPLKNRVAFIAGRKCMYLCGDSKTSKYFPQHSSPSPHEHTHCLELQEAKSCGSLLVRYWQQISVLIRAPEVCRVARKT